MKTRRSCAFAARYDERQIKVSALRDGQRGYGSTVFGSKGIVQGGEFAGCEPLIQEIIRFFKTGKPPVSTEEAIEIFCFMKVAEESKRQNGRPVKLEDVMRRLRQTP